MYVGLAVNTSGIFNVKLTLLPFVPILVTSWSNSGYMSIKYLVIPLLYTLVMLWSYFGDVLIVFG